MVCRSRTALIFGISGQDGAFLARFLIKKGYVVHGTSRDADTNPFFSLRAVGIYESVTLHSVALNDFRNTLQVITNVQPDEIYNLSGQSSVGLSFQQPAETMESIAIGTLNVLESIRIVGGGVRFYNAGSSECFGDIVHGRADETTPFRPKSPYGVAKAAAFWQVVNYREGYGLYACSGILFNHESVLRASRFATRKIASSAARIAAGEGNTLALGDLTIERDWGWAPEYVEAMWAMLQGDLPDDFVIATGCSSTLEKFVEEVFASLGLDWKRYTRKEASLFRPTDIRRGCGDPSKAKDVLGWSAKTSVEQIAHRMANAEVRRLKGLTFEDLLV